MTIILELPPEVEAGARAEAQARGVPLDVVLREALAARFALTITQAEASPKKLSAEEWERSFEEWADSFPSVPPIPAETLRRENLY